MALLAGAITKRLPLVAAVLALAACKGGPDDTPWCSAQPSEPPPPASMGLTYYRDVKPILDQKCGRCHEPGGHAPFALLTYEDVGANMAYVRRAVEDRTMPPFLAASCCTGYFQDYSLTDAEIATITGWVDQGGAPGEPAEEPPPLPQVGGLSRVDASSAMAESYTPAPPSGSTDDIRCFVLDWPLDRAAYVTGLNPRPGNRALVHHLIVGVVGPDDADDAVSRDGADGRPGFDCGGGFGDLRDVTALGGSLIGGDFPRGLGHRVEPGSKIILNMHYSTAKEVGEDRTTIDFRIDDGAEEFKSIVIANPAWLIEGAMHVPAGEDDAVFYYKFEPTLFTQGKKVDLQGVTPHMHYFGSKIVVRVLHDDGSATCLLEIPRWEFGWEQPFWLAKATRLDPDDELYVECHFDNSAANQPDGQPPRDFSWGGNNQDMCAAFVSFTDAE